MAKPNYQFAKRQRELKKAQKQELKRQKRLAQSGDAEASAPPKSGDDPSGTGDKR